MDVRPGHLPINQFPSAFVQFSVMKMFLILLKILRSNPMIKPKMSGLVIMVGSFYLGCKTLMTSGRELR